VVDQLNREERQQLMRLLIEDVHVSGSQVQIQLRIPLDPPHASDPGPTKRHPKLSAPQPLSSKDGLRSLRGHLRRVLPNAPR
jgi:hypothetical protein